MPLVVTLLLYLGCASALIAASGIGLSMLIEADGSPSSGSTMRLATTGAAPAEFEFESRAADAPPAWIAPTPKYDLPTPPIAKRAVEAARKSAERQRRVKAARQQRHDRLQTEMGGDAAADGFGGRPRLFFNPGMP